MKEIISIILIFLCLSINAQEKVQLVLPELYFDSELDSNLINNDWYGLFENKNKSELKGVDFKMERTYHFMVSDENNLEGFQISSVPENPLILLSKFNNLKEGEIEKAKVKNQDIVVNDTILIELKNRKYYLIGKGELKQDQYGYKYPENYSVILLDENGKKQIIGEENFMDDTWFKIFWAGDLDNDGFLDLIMNLSHKYSYTKLVLFLSHDSGDQKHLIRIGEHKKYHD